MNTLSLTTRVENEICHVAISGRMVLSPMLQKLSRQLLETLAASSVRGVILDMAETSDVDSAGLGELVNIYKAAADRKVALALIGVDRRTREKLDLTHLTPLLPSYPSGADAEAAIRRA